MSTGYDKCLESDLPIVSINGLNTNKDAYVGGNLTVGGTIGVTGATTLASVAVSGAVTVGGALSVTGVASFGTTGTFAGPVSVTGALSASGKVTAMSASAITATGAQAVGFSTTATFGIYYGSGAPTISAATGSLFLRTDGSGTGDRGYIAAGGTAWAVITTTS